MKTPIVDFVNKYINNGTHRFHMPGHKGKGPLGCEARDITEVEGADILYSPDGIIAESEENATKLFGTAHTFFSTEGSTLCIKAMLALVKKHIRGNTHPLILAARNVHKAFVYAVGLLDFDVAWMYPERAEHFCACPLTAKDVAEKLASMARLPDAVYITSPDYLGNIADIEGIAQVCDRYGIPLLVDNAHGAYLAFLEPSRHPIALGAAMCSDSAHKTLPVLTGGAYLHISKKYSFYTEGAREALSLFASTSPSYLILQSLDFCNDYLSEGYRERLLALIGKIEKLKRAFADIGCPVKSSEEGKIVFRCTDFGYTGIDFAKILRQRGIECEFADGEFAVFMLTPENSDDDLAALYDCVSSLEHRPSIFTDAGASIFTEPSRVMSVREAIFSRSERISVDLSEGRVCASVTVSCPPAVPVSISGERIDARAVALMKKYGIEYIDVIK